MALILELLFIICRTIALMVGVGFHDFYLSVALYSAMYVVTVVIQFFWYARVLSVHQLWLVLSQLETIASMTSVRRNKNDSKHFGV